ncbi:DUF262 domain-containing protein [Bartonella sp. HY329]|uniref:DUF262 domain-containing protein n=1 Tax=unclassified Bartonella TaxID=2645622 RepID=UPI0021C73297|nr:MULTISPECIES: DUF262 domain-containing protein [unclassified Bartonella]UXM94949.1 DUF262 domain-containing protein [Bartonella sp. HY329]UXN09272.1 DUF262 domain-containing protein [Bartonella sp. HY328]
MDEIIKNDTDDEIKLEEEIDEVPLVEFDISVIPADPSLELLVSKLERDDIIIPFYQRRFVWKIEQASRLIESFLMGLPVPQVFFYINDENQYEVIDGQQRLLSVKYFFEGYFGEPDNQNKHQVFKLKGLSDLSAYNGKTFSDLAPKDQRKLRNATLRTISIRQLSPSSQNDSVFHIFERLNTGGTQLRPQEIRNAVYRGNIVNELKTLNSDSNWQSILGLNKPDKNQKDIELLLRLFALFQNWQNYESPMVKFLNIQMAENRDFSSKRAILFKERFPLVAKLVKQNIENPFRPRRVLNIAILETIMVSLLEINDVLDVNVNQYYDNLIKKTEFLDLIKSDGTTKTFGLRNRIEYAKKQLIK